MSGRARTRRLPLLFASALLATAILWPHLPIIDLPSDLGSATGERNEILTWLRLAVAAIGLLLLLLRSVHWLELALLVTLMVSVWALGEQIAGLADRAREADAKTATVTPGAFSRTFAIPNRKVQPLVRTLKADTNVTLVVVIPVEPKLASGKTARSTEQTEEKPTGYMARAYNGRLLKDLATGAPDKDVAFELAVTHKRNKFAAVLSNAANVHFFSTKRHQKKGEPLTSSARPHTG